MNCLYILEINPLSVTLFINIFSYSVGCLFILFMTSVAVQKLLSLLQYFTRASLIAQLVKNLPAMQETLV